MAALPFLDELDWSTVDAILITHFHLDHAASLTYVMEKVRSIMSEARKKHCTTSKYRKLTVPCLRRATSALALQRSPDQLQGGQGSRLHVTSHQSCLPVPHERFRSRQVSSCSGSHRSSQSARSSHLSLLPCSTAGSDDKLFTEEEMITSWNSIIGFDFEQEILLPPSASSNTAVRFTSFAAGHVLGACMFLIEIAGTRVLYTGDYSTEEDRHLVPAKVPVWEKKPDVMICESTYGYVRSLTELKRFRTDLGLLP